MLGRRDEAVPPVEPCGVLVDGVDDDEAGRCHLARANGFAQGFSQQRPAEPGPCSRRSCRSCGD